MTQSDSKTTASPDKPITRRRIVHGAAWTVPVVAASIAAPALAASPTCPEGTPDLGDQAGWVADILTPNQFNNPGNRGGHGWWADNPRRYYWIGDNASTAPAPDAIMTLTKQIPVVAGTTYVFEYVVWSQYLTGWTPTYLGASFGDQTIGDWSNAEDVPQNPGNPSLGATRRITYTATTTGTLPFTFTTYVPARVNTSANQDFHIVFPENATTCLPR